MPTRSNAVTSSRRRVRGTAVALVSTLLAGPSAAASRAAPEAAPSPSDRGERHDAPRRRAPSPSPEDGPGPLPRDPDDRPFMDAPNGQLERREHVLNPVAPSWSRGRRLQLSVEPLYADFRPARFVGRPAGPVRGGGVGLELDLRLVRWLWARGVLSHTIHPVHETSAWNAEEESLTVTANEGRYAATHLGVGLAYALDLGRFLPLLDLGGGILLVASPAGAQAGQLHGECVDDGESPPCDLGLSCSAARVCEPAAIPELHAGIGMDVLLADHWAVGLHVRYHALLSNPADFPVYLSAALRLSFRF